MQQKQFIYVDYENALLICFIEAVDIQQWRWLATSNIYYICILLAPQAHEFLMVAGFLVFIWVSNAPFLCHFSKVQALCTGLAFSNCPSKKYKKIPVIGSCSAQKHVVAYQPRNINLPPIIVKRFVHSCMFMIMLMLPFFVQVYSSLGYGLCIYVLDLLCT